MATFNPFIAAAVGVWGFFEMLENNPYSIAYGNAIYTGSLLAKMMVKSKMFGSCPINLIAYSLGTVVVYNCLEELWRLKQADKKKKGDKHNPKEFDLIGDVVFLGGALSLAPLGPKGQIKHPEAFSLINGRCINCYSKLDFTCRFLLQIPQYGNVPLGNNELKLKTKNVENYDVCEILGG